MKMKLSEAVNIDQDQIRKLKTLVSQGEGITLEFKLKATHPEKIVRELIALANTDGGTLLVGVDDDTSLVGTKYPEEELHAITTSLNTHCRPALIFHDTIIPITRKKYILRIDVPPSDRRPHFFKSGDAPKESYVRVADKSIKSSPEMQEIIRRAKKKKDIQFTFGPCEQQLMSYLDKHPHITLSQFKQLTRLNHHSATRKLILLVLADVITITPTEKSDLYSRI